MSDNTNIPNKDSQRDLHPAVKMLAESTTCFNELEGRLSRLVATLKKHFPIDTTTCDLKELLGILETSHFTLPVDIKNGYKDMSRVAIRDFLVDDPLAHIPFVRDPKKNSNQIVYSHQLEMPSDARSMLFGGSYGLVPLLSKIANSGQYNNEAREEAEQLIALAESKIRPVIENHDLMEGLQEYAHRFLSIKQPIFTQEEIEAYKEKCYQPPTINLNDAYKSRKESQDIFLLQVANLRIYTSALQNNCEILLHNLPKAQLAESDIILEKLERTKECLKKVYDGANAIILNTYTNTNELVEDDKGARTIKLLRYTIENSGWLSIYETTLKQIKYADENRKHGLLDCADADISSGKIQDILDILENKEFKNSLKEYEKPPPKGKKGFGQIGA